MIESARSHFEAAGIAKLLLVQICNVAVIAVRRSSTEQCPIGFALNDAQAPAKAVQF
jgi:hypothetical protein